MASWTDGAAYAPIERPDGFATPEVEPLETAPPATAPTPGPMPTPSGFAPTGPTVPLDQVRTAVLARRNPAEPFLVSGGLLTAASSMGHDDIRDPLTPFQSTTGAAPGTDDLPPPTGAPLAPPMGPPVAVQMNPRTGTFQGLVPQQQSTQKTLVLLAVACAVIGLTVPAVAPWMLIAAGSLTLRTILVTGRVGHWSLGVGLLLLVFGGLIPPQSSDALSRLACLIFAGTLAAAVIRTTRRRR